MQSFIFKKANSNALTYIQLIALAIMAFVITANVVQSQTALISKLHFAILLAQWATVVYFFIKKTQFATFFKIALALAFLHTLYFFLPIALFVIAVIFYCFLFFMQSKQQTITFNQQNIVLQVGLYTRLINWQQVNYVILKDGLLTIDFKNNTLIQKEITATLTSQQEQEFNSLITQFYQ
jgi:hypothetical protein